MEFCPVVVSPLAELHEVLAGLWDVVAVELQIKWAHVGGQADVAFLLHAGKPNDVFFLGEKKVITRRVNDSITIMENADNTH